MLHDHARIHLQAGAGGDGSTSFRREAHVPRGGPDGGDGGRGGEVVLICDEGLRDLQSFRRKAIYRAGRGGYGEGSQRHGADGATLTIRVPPGTEVIGCAGPAGEEGDLLGRRWELMKDGQRAVVAKGGGGGRGNKRFATATRQAPHFSERGLPGEEGWLELKLKLLADVGLVGLPNAGKSSLLARLTRAAPKVANYPFTTLSPVLGVLDDGERQLVVADIPGLIEGASEGAGLGHDFLAHVERTRLLVHVLDLAPENWDPDHLTDPDHPADPDPAEPDHPADPDHPAGAVANYATIERELAAHDARLARLPRVLALSKGDLVTRARADEVAAEWRVRLGEEIPVIVTSSATGTGLRELASELFARVSPRAVASEGEGAGGATDEVPHAHAPGAQGAARREEDLAEYMVFRPAAGRGFEVERTGEGSFAVRGKGIERLLQRYDTENEDAMAYLEERLRKIGVLAALEAEGFQPGDELEVGGVTFELDADAPR
jgi:GTP-binding protein